MEILLANPRGFCAGVDRAIAIVERALEVLGPPLYVRHEVVHNRHVVDDLRAKGAIFVEELHEVPDDATVVFSAHGVSQAVRDEADQRGLKVFDATCPLVTKVHLEVIRHDRANHEVVMIGHDGHPEVEGTLGQYHNAGAAIHVIETEAEAEVIEVAFPEALAYVTQTTLSVDDAAKVIAILRRRFPSIKGPKKDDICYATQNRQDAIRKLAGDCDVVLVVGSVNSSNSNRLRELAESCGARAYLVDDAGQLQQEWVDGIARVGVSAGASAPEVLVQGVIDQLVTWGGNPATESAGKHEDVYFPLPPALRDKAADKT